MLFNNIKTIFQALLNIYLEFEGDEINKNTHDHNQNCLET